MSRSLKILRICLEVPHAPTDGVKIDAFYSTRELAARGHQITIIGFQYEEQDYSALEKFCEVHAVKILPRNTLGQLVRGAMEGFPVNFVKYRNQELLDLARRLVRERQFDLVMSDHSSMGWYVLRLKEEFNIRIVTRWLNFDTLIWQRWTESRSNSLQTIAGRVQVTFMRRFEKRLANVSDCCLAVGAKDAELLKQLAPEACIEFVPVGVDTTRYSAREGIAIEPLSLLLMASTYAWHATEDSVRWLTKEIMPKIWAEIPGATLYVIGKDVPRDLQEWSSPRRIKFVGFVPDERELLAKAQVFLIPMRLGAGIKIKLLTALSMAKAVVTTSAGAEGALGVEDDKNVLIRDQADDFAQAVIQLLRNGQQCSRLGRNGRELIEQEYDWKVVVDRMEEAILEVIDGAAGERPVPAGEAAST
jgi:glycosyltransferase involved in cell wall biosynthesis